MHKESEYDPDEAVDRLLELLREINKKNEGGFSPLIRSKIAIKPTRKKGGKA